MVGADDERSLLLDLSGGEGRRQPKNKILK
jgi:hypothetical protein